MLRLLWWGWTVVRWWRMVFLGVTLHWMLSNWFRTPPCRGLLCRLYWGLVWRWSALLMPFLFHVHFWPVQFWNTMNLRWLGVCKRWLLLLPIFWFVLLSILLLFLFSPSLGSLLISFSTLWGICQIFVWYRFIMAFCCQA